VLVFEYDTFSIEIRFGLSQQCLISFSGVESIYYFHNSLKDEASYFVGVVFLLPFVVAM